MFYFTQLKKKKALVSHCPCIFYCHLLLSSLKAEVFLRLEDFLQSHTGTFFPPHNNGGVSYHQWVKAFFPFKKALLKCTFIVLKSQNYLLAFTNDSFIVHTNKALTVNMNRALKFNMNRALKFNQNILNTACWQPFLL